jgi:hypothetical protein
MAVDSAHGLAISGDGMGGYNASDGRYNIALTLVKLRKPAPSAVDFFKHWANVYLPDLDLGFAIWHRLF